MESPIVTPPSEPDAIIEFVMNDAYFQEFHREWISVLGRGWRTDRIMIPLFASVAVVVAILAMVLHAPRFLALAAGLLVIAGFEGGKYIRRRNAWYRHGKTLPWYGKPLRIVLRDGDLVQDKDFAGATEYRRTGAIIPTPNGYLVRYRAVTAIDGVDSAVSRVDASIYVPHRAIQPAMSRAEFLARVSGLG